MKDCIQEYTVQPQKSAPIFSYRGCPLQDKSIPCCNGPKEHTVILVVSILQVLQGFMISLECEPLAKPDTA